MKIVTEHPEPTLAERTGPRYWRGLDELADRPEFREWVQREFPEGTTVLDDVGRRGFLKMMAASFGLAGVGLAGCRRPESHLVAYGKADPRVKPGVAAFYATSLPGARENLPLVVESHQNRPTKVEGNPGYAWYRGATTAYAQASVLDLYDPDRATASSAGTARISRPQALDRVRAVGAAIAAGGGRGVAVLATPSTSPTRARLVAALRAAAPGLLWAEHDALATDAAERAARKVFGARLRPLYRLGGARRVLAVEADFASTEPGALGLARDFAEARRVFKAEDADRMNRLYAVESVFSPTGTLADHRLRLARSKAPAFLAAVAAEVLAQTGGDAGLAATLRAAGAAAGVDGAWVTECVRDLVEHRGASVVVAGADLPEEAHVLAYAINAALGAIGRTLEFARLPETPAAATIGELVAAIDAGAVRTLVILGGNPAYDAPADAALADRLRAGRVAEVIRHGTHFDETSLLAQVHVAATHYLESWGDGRTWDGTIVPVQPLVLPLFDGVSELEMVSLLAGQGTTEPHDLVVETVTGGPADAGARAFAKFLHDGYLEGSAFALASSQAVLPAAVAAAARSLPAPTGGLEIVIRPDFHVLDGRYGNNGWMQECPDPMTKLTWENAIVVGPKLAKSLGFDTKTGRFLIGGVAKQPARYLRGAEVAPEAKLVAGGVEIVAPLQVLPGLADDTIVVTLGYGRTKVGRVGQGRRGAVRGYDAYPLTAASGARVVGGASITLTGATRSLATTQSHASMEGRAIVREANLAEYKSNPEWVDTLGVEAHSPPIHGVHENASVTEKATNQFRGNSAFAHPVFTDPHQWGMSIDLSTCTGCNACVVACQSENNIPIVGPEQVIRGREMAWIRLDRYFASGDSEANRDEIPEDPQAVVMPMMCQHCERAPCEQVCPVNATVHDEQGLNVMAYNRCVGTRYCANNCPYKVRRYNFFDWNKRSMDQFYLGPLGENRYRDGANPELPMMQRNPEVTVRMRGVMEKCTFCQQRIENAKIHQQVKAGASANILLPDGIMKTACQQACPTGSIMFGNLADETSEVVRWKSSDRDYSVLGYLNTRPRTTYLGRVRNPNPRMPDYKDQPLGRREYDQANPHPHHGGGHDDHGTGDHAGHGHP